jgi:hypothetical protein
MSTHAGEVRPQGLRRALSREGVRGMGHARRCVLARRRLERRLPTCCFVCLEWVQSPETLLLIDLGLLRPFLGL